MAELAVHPCRTLCSWSPGPAGLFSCAGCGSQWAPDQRWTPRQADGTVPPAVRAAREQEPTGAPVSAERADAAGSAGSCTTSGP